MEGTKFLLSNARQIDLRTRRYIKAHLPVLDGEGKFISRSLENILLPSPSSTTRRSPPTHSYLAYIFLTYEHHNELVLQEGIWDSVFRTAGDCGHIKSVNSEYPNINILKDNNIQYQN